MVMTASGPSVSYETVEASVIGGTSCAAEVKQPVARSLLLIMVGDKAVEQADAKGGGAFRHGRRVLFGPGDPGDVEMRPGHIVDETLDELGADNAAGAAVAGDVLDVGGIAVDRPVVAVAERQPPDRLADGLASGDQPLGQLVVVGEEPGILMAER